MGFKPGPPPANEPTDFVFLTDNRLLQNSNITRMPTTQRECNTFIMELNKWIKNETGNFDPVFTGFSTDPSGASCWWHRYGQLVHMEFDFATGTSDTTQFTITNLPSNITPKESQAYPMTNYVDNGSTLTANGSIEIGSDSIIAFHAVSSTQGGSWTGSSTKGFVGSERPSVIYSLRQPGKH